jgi:hypothetical protein
MQFSPWSVTLSGQNGTKQVIINCPFSSKIPGKIKMSKVTKVPKMPKIMDVNQF